MPISKYFKGHGEEVMSNMMKQYGAKKGKQVFYATANKRRGVTGSGPFTNADIARGYKVEYSANDLDLAKLSDDLPEVPSKIKRSRSS